MCALLVPKAVKIQIEWLKNQPQDRLLVYVGGVDQNGG